MDVQALAGWSLEVTMVRLPPNATHHGRLRLLHVPGHVQRSQWTGRWRAS